MHRKPRQCGLHFNEQITRTHFFLLQFSIRPVPAPVERAAKTLHRMSPCTPVSVPAKITWLAGQNLKWRKLSTHFPLTYKIWVAELFWKCRELQTETSPFYHS